MAELFEVLTEVSIIEQLARNAFERVMPDRMTLPQFSVLSHFHRVRDEASPAQLADAFQVTRATMTNTLQRLEAKGLVDVRADPKDGRAKIVSITPRGRETYSAARAAIAPHMTRMVAELPMPEILETLPALRAMRTWLDADRD